jgi:PAS domain S-box-containing protein
MTKTPKSKTRKAKSRETNLRNPGETRKKIPEDEDRYRTVFRLSPKAISIMDTAGHIIDLNGRIYELLGYRPEEVIGKHFLDLPFFTEESKKEMLANFTRRLRGEDIAPYEVDFIAKNGERRVGNILGALMKDDKGNPTGNIVMFSDITRFKHIEEQLVETNKELAETNARLQRAYEWMRESRDKLRNQLQQEEMGFLVDREGRIEGVTERAVECFERSRAEFIGTGLHDLLDKDFHEDFRRELKQAWKGIANLINVGFIAPRGRKICEMRMTRFNMEGKRSLLVIMR